MISVNLNGKTLSSSSKIDGSDSIESLYERVELAFGLKRLDYTLRTFTGRLVNASYLAAASCEPVLFLSVSLRLLGGKGGFGSLLKAQGALMNQKNSTNFESCRDLQGRRLKTISDANYLADYLAKEPERKRAKKEKLDKKIEEGLKVREVRKVIVDDVEFMDRLEREAEGVRDAVEVLFEKGLMKVKKANDKYKFEQVSSSDEEESNEEESDEEESKEEEGDEEESKEEESKEEESKEEESKEEESKKAIRSNSSSKKRKQ